MATMDDLQPYLKSIDFPADKQDLVREAERLGAPEDVLKALRAMPPVEYANKAEVLRSAHLEIADDQSAAEKAARARDHKHERIAEHLRPL